MSGPLFLIGGTALAAAAAVFLVFLLYLTARASWSLLRGRRCRHLAELASSKEREGDIAAAVSLFLKSEGVWAFNRWDGSRESWLKDLDQLAAVCSALNRMLARQSGTTYADFTATIREMRDVLRERKNFGVDGRKMLPEVTIRCAPRSIVWARCEPGSASPAISEPSAVYDLFRQLEQINLPCSVPRDDKLPEK